MSMSKIKELRVKYEDGRRVAAKFDASSQVDFELFADSGALVNCRKVTRAELAERVSDDILGGSVGERVCEALRARGIPLASWEYPGFVSISLTAGWSWAIGTANATWDGTMSKEGEQAGEFEFSSKIKSDSRDVEAIAEAIANHVVVVALDHIGLYSFAHLDNHHVLRAFDFALSQDAKAGDDQNWYEREVTDAQTRALRLAMIFGWDWEQDSDLCEYCLKATMSESLEADKEAFMKWVNAGKPSQTPRWYMIGPDGLHDGNEYLTEADAKLAIADFVKRYERQGYYVTANRQRIPLDKIASRCTTVNKEAI